MEDGLHHNDDESGGLNERPLRSLAAEALTRLAAERAIKDCTIDVDFLNELCEAVCDPMLSRKNKVVEKMMRAGISGDVIVEVYCAEAARRLGEGWCEDTHSFAEVSIGSARLQGLVREIGAELGYEKINKERGVLVLVRGDEQHTLGALILTHKLRRRGMSVRLIMGRRDEDVLGALRHDKYDAVLLSISNLEKLAALPEFVENMRETGGKRLPIIVGGAVLQKCDDEVARDTGADFATSDVDEALKFCAGAIALESS